MKEALLCYNCCTHIGYLYSSMPVHPIKCISCGDDEDETETEGEDDNPCQECGVIGCNGECFGDDMMGSS